MGQHKGRNDKRGHQHSGKVKDQDYPCKPKPALQSSQFTCGGTMNHIPGSPYAAPARALSRSGANGLLLAQGRDNLVVGRGKLFYTFIL